MGTYVHVCVAEFLEWELFLGQELKRKSKHCVFNDFFLSKNHAVYEIIWKNIVEPDRPQMTIWRVRSAR
jgi:hypothetical protein